MRFALLLIAAIVAVVVGVAALQFAGKNTTSTSSGKAVAGRAAVPVNTVDVLVAKTDIPLGAVIDDAMVDRQPWPSHLVLEGFITADGAEANLAGKIARAPFQAQEPITSGKIANPNDPSFLAATLPSGQRAVTIATDAVSGVAGYIFPGDRVDVLFTHNIPDEIRAIRQPSSVSARFGQKPHISEVLLGNVRVLAVNVRSNGLKESAQTANIPTSVTLAVPKQAVQRLRLAEKSGSLSLSLRSLKDQNDKPRAMPVGFESLTQAPTLSTIEDSVRIVRGSAKTKPIVEDVYSEPDSLPPQPALVDGSQTVK